MENLKKTALYNAHKELGAKIIDFNGWALPVQYEGILNEHEAVRNAAGLFDVSHMGEIEVTGKDAFDFIQKLITNDISKLVDFKISYSPICYEDGGIVDDLLIYKYHNERFLLVVNAGNTQKDYDWIIKNSFNFDVDVKNLSEEYSQLALQGPRSQEILQQLTDTDLSTIKAFYFNPQISIEGVEAMVSRTGYTGEDGFEIYCANGDIEKLWHGLLGAGKDYGIKAAGLGARDTLRFEAGLPLYGNEIDKDITPLEGGLGFFVKLDKEDFIGKEVLVKQKQEGLKRKLVGFEMGKGIPRHGYTILKEGNPIGQVTTGYLSPTLKKNIGMALIDVEYSGLGQEIDVQIRKRVLPAKIVKKGFLKDNK